MKSKEKDKSKKEDKLQFKEENNLKNYLKKSYKSIIIIAIFLLLTYWARLISESFSIDTELYLENYLSSYEWWLNLERWGLVLLNKILKVGPLIIPHANFLTILFIFIYSILFNYLFYINIGDKYKEKYLKYQFILPIIFITSPIFAEQYNFVIQSSSVSLAICFVATSLILVTKSENAKNSLSKYSLIITSIVLATIAFGTYQSIPLLYILVVICCYILKCISDENPSWLYLLKQIILFVINAGLYFALAKLLSEGNNYLNFAWSKSGINCLYDIYYSVISIVKCETPFYNISFLIAMIMLLAINIYFFIKKKNNLGIMLSSLGLALSPFFIMIVTGTYALKRTQFNYSFTIGFIILLFAITLESKKMKNLFTVLIMTLAIGIAYNQSVITANFFYSDNVRYQNDVLYANKLQSMIEQSKWYDSSKEYTLILIGKNEANAVNNYLKGEVIGQSIFEFDYEYVYGVSARSIALFKTLGYYYNRPSVEEFNEAKEYVINNNILSMPSSDSIINLDNKIIIRLSEEI